MSIDQILEVIVQYITALGLSGPIALVVQLLKLIRLIPDGWAGTAATLLNVLVFVALVVAGVFGIDVEGDQAAKVFEVLANAAQLIIMILTSIGVFKVLRGANVLGFRKRVNVYRGEVRLLGDEAEVLKRIRR